MRLIVLAALLVLVIPGARAEAGISDALLDGIGFDKLESLAGELDGPDLRRLAGEVFSGELDWRELAPEKMLKRLDRDLYYLENRNLMMDFKIILETALSILFFKKF